MRLKMYKTDGFNHNKRLSSDKEALIQSYWEAA